MRFDPLPGGSRLTISKAWPTRKMQVYSLLACPFATSGQRCDAFLACRDRPRKRPGRAYRYPQPAGVTAISRRSRSLPPETDTNERGIQEGSHPSFVGQRTGIHPMCGLAGCGKPVVRWSTIGYRLRPFRDQRRKRPLAPLVSLCQRRFQEGVLKHRAAESKEKPPRASSLCPQYLCVSYPARVGSGSGDSGWGYHRVSV